MLRNLSQILSVFLVFCLQPSAFAQPNPSQAVIYYGAYGSFKNKLMVTPNGHLNASLLNLQCTGVGEGEDSVDACYLGRPEDVCALLYVGVAEETARRQGVYRLKDCRVDRSGRIFFDVVASNDYVRMPLLTLCRTR